MSEKITLKIDNRKVVVAKGTTILEAAKKVGIEIPHLCYYRGYITPAACRLCVVEAEGARNLVASCSFPVAEGMVVKTDSERVKSARKMIIELLLSDHPYDCLTCELSGTCKLQKYAYELRVTDTRFKGKTHNFPVDTDNPGFERDYNKCILCGRCVEVCGEGTEFTFAIDFINRGFDARPSTPMDRPLRETTCTHCGQCVQACPVGALEVKERRFQGREWELKKVITTCPYCGCGCQIELNVKNNQIVKVTSYETDNVNQGNLCVKGRFGIDFVNHPERLKYPLIKKGKEFVRTSWDNALSVVAENLTRIKERYGADAIAGLASAKCTNEENYLMQKFIRAVVGTNNVDHCARLCHAPTVAGLAQAFGSGAMTNPIADIVEAETILVIGSNTTEAHPIISLQIKKAVNNGAKLIVIDPRKIELVDFACLWLSQKPGSDVAVLNGLLHVILAKKLIDREFVKRRTENFEELAKILSKYTPKYVERVSGVLAEDLIKAALVYAKSEAATIIYSMGITQHTTGTDNVLAIANLAMATGNIGRSGTGVNPLRGQNNVQGACDMGALPNFYSGYQKVGDEEARKKFEEKWKARLPAKVGLTVVEMMRKAARGDIKAMYIMGENPSLSDPDISHVEEGLKNLKFLVVQDIFLSETAKLADVVLPAASFAEKEGTFTNTERRLQLLRKAIDPPGEAKADWQIISQLAKKMGYSMEYKKAAEILDEAAELTPICCGVSHDRLQEKGLCWPCPTSDHPGTPILHTEAFTRGLGKFHPVEYKPPAEVTDKRYPLILTTGRYLQHYHTGTMSRRAKDLNDICPSGWVEICPDDARKCQVKDGEEIILASRRGEIRAKAKLTNRSPKGTVFMAFHFVEAAANVLTNAALDPVAKIPEFKVCAVKIKKIKRQTM